MYYIQCRTFPSRLPSQQSLRAYKAYEDSTQLAEACKLQVAEVSRLGACWTALQVFSFRCLVFSHFVKFLQEPCTYLCCGHRTPIV